MKRMEKGFTLVELLVTIVIIGTLAALVLTYGRSALVTSRDARKKANADDVRIALNLYSKDHENTLPVHTDTGGFNVADLSVELSSVYLTDSKVLQPTVGTVTNKYLSDAEGSNYALAFGLEGKKGTIVTSSSGVYLTNASGIAGNVTVRSFIFTGVLTGSSTGAYDPAGLAYVLTNLP